MAGKFGVSIQKLDILIKMFVSSHIFVVWYFRQLNQPLKLSSAVICKNL